jgi:hypothetical protein
LQSATTAVAVYNHGVASRSFYPSPARATYKFSGDRNARMVSRYYRKIKQNKLIIPRFLFHAFSVTQPPREQNINTMTSVAATAASSQPFAKVMRHIDAHDHTHYLGASFCNLAALVIEILQCKRV